jgi:AraC-like DNA-binding protein
LSEDVVMRRISGDTEALRLLKLYLRMLASDGATLSMPDVQRAVVDHVYDLLALALGATRDAMELARAGGLGAGRLQAIRADVLDNLADKELDIAAVARRAGLSPRQVQRLFRAQGQTFSDYLREQRLERAKHMLTRSRYAHLNVSAVAYEAGFGDLSYFNHAFRRRFGATPTEVRMEGGHSRRA